MKQHKRLGQKGFHHVMLMLALVVIAVVGFAAFRVITNKKNPSNSSSNIPPPDDQGPNYKALPACGEGSVLTKSPMDLSKIDTISPLGSINPPEHTIPTDHNYFMYHYERPDEQYDMVAPANAVITSFGYSGGIENGTPVNADYTIILSPCRGLSFRFSHINSLEGKIKDEIGPKGENADCHTNKPTTQREIINCGKTVDISISAGELMGKVGKKYVAAWDFWASKEGYVNPGITTPAYRYDADIVCGLDYFVEPIKSQIYALVKRKGEPKCGDVGQDKKDTLQGSWFAHKDPEKARTDWNSHLTLGIDSGDTGKRILAVAGKITNPASYLFTPRNDGVINRDPAQTAAGTIYCYQHDGDRRFSNGTFAGEGKVLLKLTDNHTMQAEHKSGTCSSAETLSNPTTYYR
jgi:hypothetical protein